MSLESLHRSFKRDTRTATASCGTVWWQWCNSKIENSKIQNINLYDFIEK